jgi:DNA-directed RNA polymerase subunit RPC12/RpoP
MSDVCYIRCPECGDRFKSTSDKEGKKIRCPECDEPFKVTAKMISLPKGAKDDRIQKGAKPAPEAPPPAPAAPPPPALDEFGDEVGDNPYGMVEVKVAPRCPSCANELLTEKDIICVHCGYNLLTREVGETKRTIEMTGQEHLLHLAPALGSMAFAISLLLALFYYCLVLPDQIRHGWLGFLDSEPMRLFATVPACFMLFTAGNFALNQIMFNPKPKEKEKE